MIGINFIPAARLRVRQVRRRLAWWSAGAGVWATVLVAGAMLLAGAVPKHREEDVVRRAEAARAAQERTKKEIDRETRQVAALRQTLELSALVQDHPDWSVLLTRVGELRGAAVVLRSVEVDRTFARPEFDARPVTPPGTTTPPTPAKAKAERPVGAAYVVRVSGLAQTVAEAQEFVLRLDQSGMFDSVTLLETGSAQSTGFAAMFFRVQCKVADRPASPKPAKQQAGTARPGGPTKAAAPANVAPGPGQAPKESAR